MAGATVVFYREDDGTVPLVAWLNALPPRARSLRTNCRMLYLFHARKAIVVSHGITKQQAEVPPKEIVRATERKGRYEAAPRAHPFESER